MSFKYIDLLTLNNCKAELYRSTLINQTSLVMPTWNCKNAAELVKGDENVKFYQLLKTVTKIAGKGKQTFMLGDVLQMEKK